MVELIRNIVDGFICFLIGCIHADGNKKTGTWLHEHLASSTGGTYPIVRCSACRGTIPFEWTTNYCPHCGARMESE